MAAPGDRCLGAGALAFYDTGQVAKTAIELFPKEIDIEVGVGRIE